MADEQGEIPEALERLFDQAFADCIAAGKSGDESILAGSSAVYARSALTIVAADRLTDTVDAAEALAAADYLIGLYERLWKGGVVRDLAEALACYDTLKRRALATPKPPADAGAFKRGDRVEKISGSSWRGIVVGEYSTSLTPDGYAVESEREPGSVQIYPAKALRNLPDAGEPL
jgi:hypothetical protein